MVHYASQENNISSQNKRHRKNNPFSLTKYQEEKEGKTSWMVHIKIFGTLTLLFLNTVNCLYWMSQAKPKIREIKRIVTQIKIT